MSRKVLVIAAHTDDEVIGCGGTIVKHVMSGDSVNAVFMTDGVSSRKITDESLQEKRRKSSNKAHKILGLDAVNFFDYPDNKMDMVSLLEVTQSLEMVISQVEPSIIYTHHCGDLNIDHRIVHEAVMTACRPQPGFSVREIYTFEVMSSSEWSSYSLANFNPEVFVDISECWKVKLEALQAYKDEMRETPHSRSFEHLDCLSRHRGLSVGVSRAEAFKMVRYLK